MLGMENLRMTNMAKPVGRPLHSPTAVWRCEGGSNIQRQTSNSQQAKKKLIATVPNSKFKLTRSNQRFSTFSNRNKNATPLADFFAPRHRNQVRKSPTSSALRNSGNIQAHSPVTTMAPIPPSS